MVSLFEYLGVQAVGCSHADDWGGMVSLFEYLGVQAVGCSHADDWGGDG